MRSSSADMMAVFCGEAGKLDVEFARKELETLVLPIAEG